MGITYRSEQEGKLTVQQMDNNFHYLEEQLAGLTSSNSGTSGTSGTSGQNGATGPSGTSGTSGQNGATGPTGPAGEFNVTGGISFPFLPGNERTGSGDNLQFEKGSVYQKIISTQDGTGSAPTVERLVISGGDSYKNGLTYSGEGGDIYLWAGKGQNGGDIKVDAGEGISSGGTVKVRGGYTETGAGGFVEITAGQSNNGAGGSVQVTAGAGYDGGNVYISSGAGANTGGNLSLNAGNGGTAGGNISITTAGAERMKITNDGKIGIGTASPSVALDVVGEVNVQGQIIALGCLIQNESGDGIQLSPGNSPRIGIKSGNETELIVGNGSPTPIAFYTDDTERMKITDDGKVGIGTTTPTVALDVVGDMNITGVITSTSSMILKPDSSLSTDQYIVLDPTGGSPNHIHIRAGGPIDDSTADLFIGGEDNNLRVSDTTKTVQINSKNLYTQDESSFSVGTDYGSATWSGNLITITTNGTLAFGNVVNFINAYQAATDIFTVFYDPATAVSLNITNKDISNYPTHVLTVDQSAPTASLAITGIDIEIIRYQSGRVIADNGTVTIQTGDTDGPENWVFGTTGSITFPDNSVQTTAYAPTYKVYTALLTQSGTASPTATILENTIGNVTFTRENQGVYRIYGNFPYNKTVASIPSNVNSSGLYPVLFYLGLPNYLEIGIKDNSSIYYDNEISYFYIEIRVYN